MPLAFTMCICIRYQITFVNFGFIKYIIHLCADMTADYSDFLFHYGSPRIRTQRDRRSGLSIAFVLPIFL